MVKHSILIIISLFMSSHAFASAKVFSDVISKDSLRIIKRIEYRENIPSGLLHAMSLVETNIGQSSDYMPWPYSLRLNSYKSKTLNNVDDVFDELDNLVDIGYTNFDIEIDDKPFYGLTIYNLENILNDNIDSTKFDLSARSLIKYYKNKEKAEYALNKVLNNKWYDFKIGAMQISYEDLKTEENLSKFFNTYDNVDFIISKLKAERQQATWWEAIGKYHSKNNIKAKRYSKNVWSIYQRVHKIKVR